MSGGTAETQGAKPPPCTLCDFLWEHFACEGAEALPRGDLAAAAAGWRTTDDLTLAFAEADPRRAATRTALGVIAARQGRFAEAQELCRRALALWDRAPEWIARMDVELKAHSSLFHMRLEARHRNEIVHLGRVQNERMAAAGRAAALATLAALAAAAGRTDEAGTLYHEAIAARAKGLSHREEAAGWLNDDLAAALAPDSAEGRTARGEAARIARDPVPAGAPRFLRRSWRKMTDERRLTAAVELAPLLRLADLRAVQTAG